MRLGSARKSSRPTVASRTDAHALAATLARGPRSLGLTKRELLRNGICEPLAEAELPAIAGKTADFAEAHAAFGQKARAGFSRNING